jgi:peptidoglycan/xylan/chitin deacetylase (PgdA/CDA1 family)
VFQWAEKAFRHLPGRFGIARLLGPSYSLRCVVFHDIALSETPFTAGMNVSTPRRTFEASLEFLTSHYTPVSLSDVLADPDGRRLPPRPVLVTFDDAYASVVELAVPLCVKFRVPAVFFVNAAFLDNKRLAPDNLVCYVANTMGMGAIDAAARSVRGAKSPKLGSLSDVFMDLFPLLTLSERDAFLESIQQSAGVSERDLARDAGLYLTSEQLRSLASFNFEIGNHTYTHVHCRSLSPDDLRQEVGRNKEQLEEFSGRKVRSFSQPYGSSQDLTPELTGYLRQTGHEAAFLSESTANSQNKDKFSLDRVSSRAVGDNSFFLEIEVLPRLRTLRNEVFRKSGRDGNPRPSAN